MNKKFNDNEAKRNKLMLGISIEMSKEIDEILAPIFGIYFLGFKCVYVLKVCKHSKKLHLSFVRFLFIL